MEVEEPFQSAVIALKRKYLDEASGLTHNNARLWTLLMSRMHADTCSVHICVSSADKREHIQQARNEHAVQQI